MKQLKITVFTLFILSTVTATALAQFYGQDQTVRGYTRQNGTIVQPYHRTMPDNTPLNNYSTRGNVNPYTGQMGTVNPYQPMNPMQSNPYGQQRRSWP